MSVSASDDVVQFILDHQSRCPLVYSSGDPDSVKQAQQPFGQRNISQRLNQLFGDAARKLVYDEVGIQRLVGGGEASGALDLGSLQVRQESIPACPRYFHSMTRRWR